MMEETVTTATDPNLAKAKRDTYEAVVADNRITTAAAAKPDEIVVPAHEKMKTELAVAHKEGKASGIFNLLTGKK